MSILFACGLFIIACESVAPEKPTTTPTGWMPESYVPKDAALVQLADSALQLQTAALMDPTMNDTLRQDNLNAAFSLLTAVLERDPKYSLVYSNLAAIYLENGDTTQAIAMMKQRLDIEPELAEGWQAIGFFHDKTGDSTSAFTFYQKSIDCFDNRLKLGKQYANPNDLVYYYDNMAGRAYSLLLLGQTAASHNAVRELLDEATGLMGEEAGVYAAMLQMNRWTMLQE